MSGIVKSAPRREGGAIATVVAVILFTGVAFGMLALSLDVGQMMMEKRQLQNGADSVSMYLARDCAQNNKCDVAASNAATTALNNNNSSTNSNDLQTRCFYNLGGTAGLSVAGSDPACDPAASQSGAFADCGPLPPGFSADVPYVQVATRSRPASTSGLRNWTAPLIGGSSDSSVGACARAAWGSPGFGSGIPITMSMCDWQIATGWSGPGTATYPAAPDYTKAPGDGYNKTTNPWPTFTPRTVTNADGTTYQIHPLESGVAWEDIVYTKDTAYQDCPHSSPGGSAPGGFDALAETGCITTFENLAADGTWWAHGDTGNDAPCKKSGGLDSVLGKVVQIPIYDCVTDSMIVVTSPSSQCETGHGKHTYYRISGFASFYLSGWNLSGKSQNSIRMEALGVKNKNAEPCSGKGSIRCLSGWFTQDVVSSADFIMSPPPGTGGLGTSYIGPAG